MPPPPASGGPGRRLGLHASLLVVRIAFGSLAVEGTLATRPRFGVSPPALATRCRGEATRW